jgi:hypothetical protein
MAALAYTLLYLSGANIAAFSNALWVYSRSFGSEVPQAPAIATACKLMLSERHDGAQIREPITRSPGAWNE